MLIKVVTSGTSTTVVLSVESMVGVCASLLLATPLAEPNSLCELLKVISQHAGYRRRKKNTHTRGSDYAESLEFDKPIFKNKFYLVYR